MKKAESQRTDALKRGVEKTHIPWLQEIQESQSISVLNIHVRTTRKRAPLLATSGVKSRLILEKTLISKIEQRYDDRKTR